MVNLGFPVRDADNHYYEPPDCFTRYLEPKYSDRSLHVVARPDGLGRLYFGARPLGFMRVLQTDYTGAPGSLRELFEGDSGGGFEQKSVISAYDYPAMMERDARVAQMDAQELAEVLMFPSLAVAVEHEMHDDVEACYANLRAFNRWVEQDWGFGRLGRIHAAPLLSLLSPELAVAELDRVLAAGAELVHVKPGPAYGRSPAGPEFDPFWRRLDEARVPVAFHAGDSGYNELWSVQWGEKPRPPLQFTTPFQWYLGLGERPIVDTLANLVLNDLFGRFPNLRVLSIENGSHWVPGLLAAMDKAVKMGRRGIPVGGSLPQDKPSAVFREHVYVAPFFEEDPMVLVDAIGADRVLFGSDWPHAEGLADPVEYAELLGAVSEEDQKKIMSGNLATLLRRSAT